MVPTKVEILIVESFQANIELIILELQGGLIHFNYEIAYTKKEFKNKLLYYKPDLILSNNIFTSFDGLSLFNIKKKLAPHTPFIFISYPARAEHMIEFFKSGLTAFVLKDNLSSLSMIVKRVVQDIEVSKTNEDFSQKNPFY